MSMLQEKYKNEAVVRLKERFGHASVLEVPKIKKVVVNTGIGRLVAQKTGKEQEQIAGDIASELGKICGQKPVITRGKISISAFKLREGMPTGLKVTLRGQRMYDFIERLIYIALPRSRDFRGVKVGSVDSGGNLTIGIPEHIIFPEILPEESRHNFGLQVTIATYAKSKEEAIELFRLLGFPLEKEEGQSK
jgi:large subunit ribosomal protein L5